MTRKFALAAIAAVLMLTVAQGASAHDDPNTDPGNRCDTWWRNGHTTSPNDSHNHSGSADISAGGVTFHNHGGHYVLRTNAAYVEVVGGQGYRGPSPSNQTNPGQGGYVQGEIDPVKNGPDADFHANTFAPDVDHPPSNPNNVAAWANGYNYLACVNVEDSRVIDIRK